MPLAELVGRVLPRFNPLLRPLTDIKSYVEHLRAMQGRTMAWQVRAATGIVDIQDAEFSVFSQFGDDGIIQYLTHTLGLRRDRFVEFGVEDYTEANTRFLLVNDNWSGLILDGSDSNIARVRSSPIYWRHDLRAVSAFVTRDNINALLESNGFTGNLGLLSIDIDGNDYWVWEAIDVVNPTIVVAEYNSVFGAREAVTVPYDPTFVRTKAHHSNLYWGASLRALELLAHRKGYALVGSNSSGNNAYFVRRDVLGKLRELDAEQAYVESRFREARDHRGSLTFLSGKSRRESIAHMSVVDVETMLTRPLGN